MASTTKTEKRKRFVLTLRQKIDICKMLDDGVRRSDIMREFNISSSTLYDIKARKDELIKFCAESESDKVIMKRKVLSKPKLEQLDTVLYKWFRSKRSEGVAVSGPMLIEKAKDFYKQMNLNDKCTFSEGWLSCFKHRHGITKQNISVEQKSSNRESVEQYCETFASLIKEHELTAEQIYNADKTALFWRCLPSFSAEDSDHSDAAESKSRMTVLTCANAAGTHKLKLLVIGNHNSSAPLKNITHLPVVYKSQHNSCIDEIFYEWFHQYFVPEVKEHFRKVGMPEESKAALLLDNSKPHLDEARLVSGNAFTIHLPASVASSIQPMDQGITQSMKCNYKRELLRKLVSHDSTVQNFQANFTIKDALYSLAAAWTAVKMTTLRKAWRKLWPDSAFEDKSSDEEFEILDDRSNLCIPFLSDVRNSLSSSNTVINIQDIIQTWLSEDLHHTVTGAENFVHILNHNTASTEQSVAVMKEKASLDIADQHLQSINHNTASTEQSTVVKKASWDTAAHHLQEFIRFAETSSSYSPMEIVNLHILRTLFENKRRQFIYNAD